MRLGDVFVWTNYPNPRDGNIKDRWFVFLGETGPADPDPVTVVYQTTTTRFDHYEAHERRAGCSVVRFEPESSPFDAPCLIDLGSFPPEVRPRKILEDAADDLVLKGTLDLKIVREIYDKLADSQKWPRNAIMIVRASLERAGMTALKKPKSSKFF